MLTMSTRSKGNTSGSITQTRGGPLNVLLWVAQVGVAAYLGIWHAVPKLIGAGSQPEMFDAIGLGQWFRYFVGVLELAGSIGLLIPPLAGLAALGLAGVMVGATLANLFVIPGGSWAGITAGLCAVCGFVAWGRWAQTRSLIKAVAAKTTSPRGRSATT